MGRKPVLGLVGACLASVALVGCDHQNLAPSGTKKDVTSSSSTGSTGNAGWKTLPANQGGVQTGGATGSATAGAQTWGNNSQMGNTVAGGNGSFNVNPRGPAGDYPEGRTMPPQAGGATGAVERSAYPGTTSPEVKVTTTTTALPQATSTTGGDPGAGGLPPLNKPLPTGGVTGGAGQFTTPTPMSTLPPLTPPGAARPRVDDLPSPPTTRGPVIVPPMSGAPTSGAPDISAPSGAMPPPAPVPADTEGLPPIPTPPSSPGTQSFQTPPLPSAPLPRNTMGVPQRPSNQAGFQQ
jgi:hypothetical protein